MRCFRPIVRLMEKTKDEKPGVTDALHPAFSCLCARGLFQQNKIVAVLGGELLGRALGIAENA